jgi:hypothetical protein
MALKLASHIPVGRLFYHEGEPGKAWETLSQVLTLKGNEMVIEINGMVAAIPSARVTSLETITYRRREIGKELLPLEKHSQQLCRIGGVACDCCEKHPITIEALAQETLGMT